MLTQKLVRSDESKLIHFRRRRDGFAGSRTVIFHGTMKFGLRTLLSDLADGIYRCLETFPFTCGKVRAKHFSSALPRMGGILKAKLGLKQFSGK
jgi:hypothetical protein